MKLLIVDDHVVVREGVCRLLPSLSGVLTYEASSAAEALGLFRIHARTSCCSISTWYSNCYADCSWKTEGCRSWY
jgi:CheY-like chemotaxis protein